jgi:signal transduction histidine kinase
VKLIIGNRLYWWGFLPLYDAKGIENGEIVALFDMTEPNANAHKAVLVISLICAGIGILLFISFYIMLGRVEQHLEKSHLSLIEAHNELETKVEARTTELVKANKELHDLSAHLQSVREEERTHVAREIHDELGQILTGLQIDFSNLIMELPQKKKTLIEKGKELSELIDRSILTVQRISEELRPSLLDKLGIIPAIEWHAEEFQNRIGIKCEFTYDTETLVLDKDRSLAIFRIFQEALTNVARHSNATKVVIDLKNENNSIKLQINDNGMGIAKEEIASSRSLGIIGIKERSQSVGGDIKIDTAYGKGTTITLTVPLFEKVKESRG